MADFDVPTPNYQPVDWSWLAGLPDDYYKGAQQKQQYDMSRAFQGGLPKDAQGNPDYRAIMQVLAQKGDPGAISSLAAPALQQSQAQQASTLDPMLAPGGASQPQPQPTAPLTSNPPASAALAQPTTTGAPAPTGGAGNGETVAALVGGALQGSDKAPVVAGNVAKALGVSPDAPLTTEQAERAQRIVKAYLARTAGPQLPGSGLLARGLRNNNPDNIENGSFASQQPGYAGAEPQGRFAKFATPEAGMNAAQVLLAKYGQDGANTVSAVVAKWAPSSDGNNVSAYSNFVAKQLGVEPNTPLDMKNPQVRQALATAMAKFENGGGPGAGPQSGSPQRQPLVPQVPLPKGYTDPQQAILALRAEAAKYTGNPQAAGQAQALNTWADRIETSQQPVPVRAGETLVNPRDGTPVYQAPGMNPNGIALQRYLAENPDATPEQIQAFLQSGRSPGRSAITMFMNKYEQEHPDATSEDVKRAAQNYTTETTAQNRFLSGPQGNTIRSLNVVVSHLQTMQDLGNALQNGNVRLFNELGQKFAEETGQPAPTSFDTAKQIVGAEIIKALGVAGAGTQTEREEAANAFNRASSPQQLSSAIEAARRLLIGQLQGLRRQYVASTHLSGESFDQMLEPQTQQFFGDDSGSSGDQSGGQGSSAAQTDSSPQKISTKAEYDALASGTQYVAPDGSVRTKQ